MSEAQAITYRINDALHPTYAILEKNVTEVVKEFDAEITISYIMNQWVYASDLKYWDVANPPVQSFLTSEGDCDDHARLMTYILHTKGHSLVYWVGLASDDSGHATAVYYDLEKRQLSIIDVNGVWIRQTIEDFDELVHIPLLIKRVFEDTNYVNIRTWDTRKSIAVVNVKESSTDEIFSQ